MLKWVNVCWVFLYSVPRAKDAKQFNLLHGFPPPPFLPMATTNAHVAHGKFLLDISPHTLNTLHTTTSHLSLAHIYADFERALMHRWSHKPYVVLGACGMHGALELGGLAAVIGGMNGEAFWRWRKRLRGAGGVSIGSFIATLIALGFDLSTIAAVYKDFPFHIIFKDDAAAALSSITGLDSLANVSGIMTGASLRTAVYAAFKLLSIRLDITFRDLAEAALPSSRPFDLRILATDLLNLRATIFSAKTTPDVPIIDAVVASMSIPAMFRPVTIPGHGIFVDGGIIDPAGFDLFAEYVATRQVLHILKLSNIEPENRAFTLPQVVTTCLSVKGNYDIGRRNAHARIDILSQFAGAAEAQDETQLHNPFHVFDLPDVNQLIIDGCVSVETSILLYCAACLYLLRKCEWAGLK